jgi:hypothetical protein
LVARAGEHSAADALLPGHSLHRLSHHRPCLGHHVGTLFFSFKVFSNDLGMNKQFFNFPFEQNIKNEDDTKLADSIRPSLQYQKFLACDISLSVILYLFLNI